MPETLQLHPSLEAVKPILDRHEDDFRYILDRGWERWLELPVAHRRAIAALEGGLATNVAAFMKEAAAERFDGRRDEGIVPRDRYDPPSWSLYNRVLVRFKKMDGSGLSRNYPTKRARRYLLNLPIEEEELREAVRVEVGYCLNELETEVAQQWVVHRRGERIVWKYGLQEDGTAILPLPLSVDESDEGGSFVRPRPFEEEVAPFRNLRLLNQEEALPGKGTAESEATHDIGSG